jgi:hypothetical protein
LIKAIEIYLNLIISNNKTSLAETMKFLVLLLGILLCGQATKASPKNYFNLIKHREPPAPSAISSRAVSEKWITQKLDHFNTADTRIFQMVSY